LRIAEGDPLVGVEARTTLTGLRDWSTAHGRSYGHQVGSIMIDAVGRTVREVRELLARIKARADAVDISSEIRARQRKLAMLMKIFAGVSIVALGMAGVLIGLGRLSYLWGAIVGTGALLTWAIVSVITFMRGQRDLFQEMAKRQADAAQADADRLNLRTALRDLNRLTNAYGQYLCWSKAIGAMLREPFGPATAEVPDRPLIGHGLPLSVKVGSARPSPDVIANAGLQVRRELFGVGWLSPVWQQLIENAGIGLGALGEDVRDNARRLFADAGEGTGSTLDVWSEHLARGEVTATGSEALWHRAMSSLVAAESTVGRSLSDTVETVTDGDSQVVRIDEFMAGSDSDEFGVQYFDDELFTDTAAAAGDNRVANNIRSSVRNGLGAVAILTQLSDAIPEFQFRFCEREPLARSDFQRASDLDMTTRHRAAEQDPFATDPGSHVPPRPHSDRSDITDPLTGPPGSGTYVF
jgi:hypothetical protein